MSPVDGCHTHSTQSSVQSVCVHFPRSPAGVLHDAKPSDFSPGLLRWCRYFNKTNFMTVSPSFFSTFRHKFTVEVLVSPEYSVTFVVDLSEQSQCWEVGVTSLLRRTQLEWQKYGYQHYRLTYGQFQIHCIGLQVTYQNSGLTLHQFNVVLKV